MAGHERPVSKPAIEGRGYDEVIADAASAVLLRAEMKLPGEAWLQFNLTPQHRDRTLLRCCAWFQPRGLAGEIYWCGLYPLHAIIFSGMLRAIRNHAEQSS